MMSEKRGMAMGSLRCIAEAMVDTIIKDLESRKDFGDAWWEIDKDIQSMIREQ